MDLLFVERRGQLVLRSEIVDRLGVRTSSVDVETGCTPRFARSALNGDQGGKGSTRSHRHLAWPESARERLIDDSDRRTGVSVSRIEVPPGQEQNAECAEIAW